MISDNKGSELHVSEIPTSTAFLAADAVGGLPHVLARAGRRRDVVLVRDDWPCVHEFAVSKPAPHLKYRTHMMSHNILSMS